jgi:hypothetical protein
VGEEKEKVPGSKNTRIGHESTEITPYIHASTNIPLTTNTHLTPFNRLDPAQLRIFTSEEKKIEDWVYEQILPARDWFYQNHSDNEAYNKTLMLRLI